MNFKNGRGFKQSEWQNSGIPIIRIQNLNNANAPFNHFHGDYEDDILILAGDLLFAWSGTVGSSFGPHIWERSKGLLNQHIFKVTHSGALDRRYAYYALKEATARIESQVNGSVGLRHVTKKTMNSILIPLPPLDEQKRIVAKLDEVSKKITSSIKLLADEISVGKDLWLGILSKEFDPKSLNSLMSQVGAVFRTTSGGTPLKSNKNFYQGGTVPWLLSGEVGNYEITEARKFITEEALARTSAKKVESNSVLVAMYGATAGEVGLLTFPSTTNQAVCSILPAKNQLPRFVYYALLESKGRLVAQAAGNAQPNISQAKIRELPYPMVAIKAQEEVVQRLDDSRLQIDRLLNLLDCKIERLVTLRTLVLGAAFAGEL